jgi:hypothetical protein
VPDASRESQRWPFVPLVLALAYALAPAAAAKRRRPADVFYQVTHKGTGSFTSTRRTNLEGVGACANAINATTETDTLAWEARDDVKLPRTGGDVLDQKGNDVLVGGNIGGSGPCQALYSKFQAALVPFALAHKRPGFKHLSVESAMRHVQFIPRSKLNAGKSLEFEVKQNTGGQPRANCLPFAFGLTSCSEQFEWKGR